MFRKLLILFLWAPLLMAALAAGTSLPVIFLMISLLFVALATSSPRDELQD